MLEYPAALIHQIPELATPSSNFKIPARGQHLPPVTDAKGIATIIMLFPKRAAEMACHSAANELVMRYLGGDLSVVRGSMHNHNVQVDLDADHPAVIFG